MREKGSPHRWRAGAERRRFPLAPLFPLLTCLHHAPANALRTIGLGLARAHVIGLEPVRANESSISLDRGVALPHAPLLAVTPRGFVLGGHGDEEPSTGWAGRALASPRIGARGLNGRRPRGGGARNIRLNRLAHSVVACRDGSRQHSVFSVASVGAETDQSCGLFQKLPGIICHQISTSDRTHARTGPDTPQAQARDHTRNTDTRKHTHSKQNHLLYEKSKRCRGPRALTPPTI